MAGGDLGMSIFDFPSGDPIADPVTLPMPPQEESQPAYFSDQVEEARRFYLDINPASRRPLGVASGGWERCRPDYDLRRSGFFCPIIELVERGEGWLELGGREYRLRPGTVFVYGRGIAHRIRASREAGLSKYFVAIRGKGAAELLAGARIGGVFETMHPERITPIFDDLISHGLGDHLERARLCLVALQYLVMKIGDLATPYRSGEGGEAVMTYQRCRRFIEENHRRVRSVQEAAAACHIDRAYLCRLFKRFRRQTPYEYLQHLRMNAAVDLLQNRGRSVKAAAAELGFPDPYNFSRAFKRVFGVSPSGLAGGNPRQP